MTAVTVWFSALLAIFEAGSGGYMAYRIPGMVRLGDGTILAYAEARKDGTGDWADIDLVLRRSTDGGHTWSAPVVLVDEGTLTTNNLVAIPGKGRHEVHLIYCVNYARAFHRFSKDSGKTFSAPVEITSAFAKHTWNVIATGPGHGLRLRDGRLLVPVWLSTGGRAHRPSVVSTLYSDDEGKTWQTGDVILGKLKNPSETIAEQLADGRVMMNIRSESAERRRAVVYSRDGSSNWTEPAFVEELIEPICMASLLRYPGGPLLFANPAHLSQRRNLTLFKSTNEAKSWQVVDVLDPEQSAYSDMTVTRQGELLVLYEKARSLVLKRLPAQLFRK